VDDPIGIADKIDISERTRYPKQQTWSATDSLSHGRSNPKPAVGRQTHVS
jgi:hypothetical protein